VGNLQTMNSKYYGPLSNWDFKTFSQYPLCVIIMQVTVSIFLFDEYASNQCFYKPLT